MSGELFCFRVIDELGFWHFISKYDPSCGVYFGRSDKDGSAIYTGDTIEFTDYSCSVYGLSDPVEFKNTAEVVFENDRFTLSNYKDNNSDVKLNLEQGMTFNWSGCKIVKRKSIKSSSEHADKFQQKE